MRDFQGRKSRYKFFRSNLFAIILIIVFLFVLRNVWDVYKKSELARINKEEAAKKLENLNNKKKSLEVEIERLGTDRGVEEELRNRFQVVRPGEQVMIIIDKKAEVKDDTGKLEVNDSLLSKIWSGMLGLVGF